MNMEEVDRIIIDSLRHLNCEIEDDISNLKEFNPDTVVAAISTCLETMNPQVKLPKKLPPSMSARIKFASNLAQQIKEFGFKGDMGYQTILYCNEVEVRRVLMFLIERLPKESSHMVSMEATGYVPRIVKQIEDNLKESLGKMWLPTGIMHYGTRQVEHDCIVHSFGNSCPVDCVKLTVPDENTSIEEALQIPNITQQCSARQLIPSLMFDDFGLSSIGDFKKVISKPSMAEDVTKDILKNIPSSQEISDVTNATQEISEKSVESKNRSENNIEDLLNNMRQKKDALIALQDIVNGYEKQLEKLKSQTVEEQKFLKNSEAKVKVKTKTLAVLNNEENKIKLRNLIQKSEKRLVDLADQWKEVQTPLLEEHKTLKISISSESLKQQDKQNKLLSLRRSYKELVADFKQKAVLEQNLIERCKELNNKNNRAAYTKRILEIVGNIKKQNKEIQKILSDTKQVQKDINTLTGQVDRSFTLSDELIFRDCKQDESARKAYKLLAALREECNGILQAVSGAGQAERELRNLEEQVEIEKSKDFRDKLDKVQRDLAEIKREIQVLM